MKISKEQYEQLGGSQPYLNVIDTYVPDEGRERHYDDDHALILDMEAEKLKRSLVSTTERIHMPQSRFDEIFQLTLKYFETTERLLYEGIQTGNQTKEYLNEQLDNYLERTFKDLCQYDSDKNQMIKRLDIAICQYYVLQPLIDNPDTTDIKVCGPDDIRVRIKGKAYSSQEHFLDAADLAKFIEGLAMRNGVAFTEPVITFTDTHDSGYILRFVISHPMICSVPYPYMHIRKVSRTKPTLDTLCTAAQNHMVNPVIKDYLINRAKYSRGIVFAGPPGSGKTTLLNAFIEYIPKTRETLVIQENDELFTRQPGFMFKHVSHGFNGGVVYTLEDLGRMALVEGCNEFIIGEVKGGEMRNVMTLINAGGYAALTVHSTNAYETMDKLADLVKYGSSYTFDEARRMLGVMDTIVYMDGYKVRQILEIHGYNGETGQYNYEKIYRYTPEDDARWETKEAEQIEQSDDADNQTGDPVNNEQTNDAIEESSDIAEPDSGEDIYNEDFNSSM